MDFFDTHFIKHCQFILYLQMRCLIVTFLFLFLKILTPPTVAQSVELKNYSVDEGLPSSYVYRVVPDSKGFMWILTDKGIARFDGRRFQNFTLGAGQPINSAFSMGEDSHQRLWLYTGSKYFIYFDLKDNRFYKIKNTAAEVTKAGYYTYIFENTEGGLTFYNSNRIAYSLDKNLKLIGKKEMPPFEQIIQRNYPQISLRDAFYAKKQAKDSLLTQNQNPNLPPEIFTYPTIYATSAVQTDSALFYRKGMSLVAFANGKTVEKKLSELAVKEPSEFRIYNTGKANLLLVHTLKEAFVVDAQLNRVREYDFVNEYTVNTIYIDKKNNVWICTEDNGIVLKRSLDLKILPKTILPNMPVHALEIGHQGEVFIGTSKGDLFRYKNGFERKIDLRDGPNIRVRLFCFNKKNNLFVAWDEAPHTIVSANLLRGDEPIDLNFNDRFKQTNFAQSPEYQFFTVPFKTKQLDILNYLEVKSVAQNTEGVIYYCAGTDLRMASITDSGWVSKRLFTTRALALTCDGFNALWIARPDGLFRFQNNKLDSLSELKRTLPTLADQVQYLAADGKNNLWMSTNATDLCVVNPENKTLNCIKEISNEYVVGLSVDAQNRVWVATNNGVSCVEVTSETPFTYRYTRISRSKGLPTQDVLAAVADAENLYVGTPKGLTIFDLKDLFSSKKESLSLQSLVISNLKINNLDTILRGYYDLPYDKNNLDIDFTSISFNNEDPLQYEYRLLQKGNSDTAWRRIEIPHIEFAFLPFGQYMLEVRALYDNEIVSVLTEPLVFNIRQAFWKTPWFIFALLAALASGIYLVYRYDIKKIKEREAEKLQVAKRISALEMEALQSQMNPHFVFNALTSIQNFIWNKDVKQANAYLTRFSKLMRQFLDFSRQKFVTLEDEMDLIKNYVELEKMRFPERFDVQYEMSADLEPTTEIPSAMIQPFVENAINHGLLLKKEKGLLKILFLKENSSIHCIIEDNGIGRDAAAERKSITRPKHRSQATKILNEKIELFRQTSDVDVRVTIEDKTIEKDAETGTKVTIQITSIE